MLTRPWYCPSNIIRLDKRPERAASGERRAASGVKPWKLFLPEERARGERDVRCRHKMREQE